MSLKQFLHCIILSVPLLCRCCPLSSLDSRQITPMVQNKCDLRSVLQQMFPFYLYISDCGQFPTFALTNDTNLNVRKLSTLS